MKYVLWSMFYVVCFIKYVLCSMLYDVCFMLCVVWSMFYVVCFMKYVLCSTFYEYLEKDLDQWYKEGWRHNLSSHNLLPVYTLIPKIFLTIRLEDGLKQVVSDCVIWQWNNALKRTSNVLLADKLQYHACLKWSETDSLVFLAINWRTFHLIFF